MDAFVRDIKQTFRLLSSNRGFAGAAFITIGLGVGGTAAVFSVVYGVLLRPLSHASSPVSRLRRRRRRALRMHEASNARSRSWSSERGIRSRCGSARWWIR